MSKRILIVFIATLSALISYSQQVYEGTIGSYPVVLGMTIYDDRAIAADYFYVRQKRNISLSGVYKQNGDITLTTGSLESEASKNEQEIFELKEQGDTYTGLWILGKKKLAVKLKLISVAKLKSPYGELKLVKEFEPYKYVLSSGFLFNKDSVSSSNGYSL